MITRRAALLPLVFAAACTETKKVEKKPEEKKPAEPVTGKYAFFQMYGSARRWAPDIQSLRLRNIRIQQVQDKDGKCAVWEATFVSPSKRRMRIFTYSVVEAEGNLHEGVYQGLEEPWAGPSGQAIPWVIQAFKIDSDEAYQTAVKKSAAYMAKNPDKPILYILEQTRRHPNLAWRIVWGESVQTSNYSVMIDASTGGYLETLR